MPEFDPNIVPSILKAKIHPSQDNPNFLDMDFLDYDREARKIIVGALAEVVRPMKVDFVAVYLGRGSLGALVADRLDIGISYLVRAAPNAKSQEPTLNAALLESTRTALGRDPRAIFVDDLIQFGVSAKNAIFKLRDHNVLVEDAVFVLEGEGEGRKLLKQNNISAHSLATWTDTNGFGPGILEKVQTVTNGDPLISRDLSTAAKLHTLHAINWLGVEPNARVDRHRFSRPNFIRLANDK